MFSNNTSFTAMAVTVTASLVHATTVEAAELATLQTNLLCSHACGVGEALAPELVRASTCGSAVAAHRRRWRAPS